MSRYEDESGELPPEVRPASSDDVKSMLDAIDMRLRFDDELPPPSYDEVVPLIPVAGMKEFGFKRGSPESTEGEEVAQVHRRWERPEIEPGAEVFEVVHILQTPKGFDAKRQTATSTSLDASRDVSTTMRDFFKSILFSHETGGDTVTTKDCSDVVEQLNSTRILR